MPALLSIEALEADRRHVEGQLAGVQDDRWGTVRLMWVSRLADIDRRIDELAARRSSYASVALMFDGNPVIGAGDIRLDFATEALDSYQKLVSLTLATNHGQDLPKRGPVSAANRSRLFIRDVIRGSMGFMLEEVPLGQGSLLSTELKDAVEGTTKLLLTLSSDSEEAFATVLEETPPRLISAVQRFAKLLHEAGASTKIVGDEERIELSIDDVGRLSNRLNEIEVTEEIVPVDGVLWGVLPEARQFELKLPGDEGQIMRGTISDELALKYTADVAFKERLLLQPVRAQLRFIHTMRSGRLVREQRVLEALEPAPR